MSMMPSSACGRAPAGKSPGRRRTARRGRQTRVRTLDILAECLLFRGRSVKGIVPARAARFPGQQRAGEGVLVFDSPSPPGYDYTGFAEEKGARGQGGRRPGAGLANPV